MDIDIFKEILAPVVGGLGIFLLGLEFMERGIQALSANRMRELLAKMAAPRSRGCSPARSSPASSSPPRR